MDERGIDYAMGCPTEPAIIRLSRNPRRSWRATAGITASGALMPSLARVEHAVGQADYARRAWRER